MWIVFVCSCVKITLRFSPELSTFRQVSTIFGALFYLELILLLNTLLRNFPSLFLLSGTKKAAIATFQESLFYRNTALRTKCHYVKLTFSSLPKSWIPWLFQVLLRHITNKKLRNEVKTRKQYPRSPKCSHRSQLTGYLRYLPLGLCNEPHHSLVY